jgi:hypothetical protein
LLISIRKQNYFSSNVFFFSNSNLLFKRSRHCFVNMLKNFSAYSVLWILLQLLVGINCLIISHTATLIDDKLYILYDEGFFYFDVSLPLNINNLERKNLTTIVPPNFLLHPLKVVQITIRYSYMEETILKWNWFIHLILKVIHGVFQK